MKTVVGLFDTYAHAETAAHDLERAGFSHNDISLVANNENNQFGPATTTTTTTYTNQEVGAEAGRGAVAGGVAGLLLGLAAFAIPGLGAIAAAGWLTTTITGVVVGAGVGVAGALMGVGVPHEDAVTYAEGVRRGGTLLAVRARDDQADRAAQILGADGAVDINKRAEQYRQEGFVPTAPVASASTATTFPAVTPVSSAVNSVPTATVRQTEAESMRSEHVGRSMDYSAYENDFRDNWRSSYANHGGRYEDYEPAYEYGYELRNDPRYRDRDWNSAQADIQSDWETRYPGTWDRMKNSVRYSWDKVTGAERGGIQTGSQAVDGMPDTRGITEKISDAVTGDRIDDKTGKVVR